MGFIVVNQKKIVVYRRKSRVDFKCSEPKNYLETPDKLNIWVQIDWASVWSLIFSNKVHVIRAKNLKIIYVLPAIKHVLSVSRKNVAYHIVCPCSRYF